MRKHQTKQGQKYFKQNIEIKQYFKIITGQATLYTSKANKLVYK